MKSIISTLLLATSVNALIPRNKHCCFHLSAHGGPGGPVEQLYDGQNRIGQSNLPQGQYCIDGNGGLTDGKGRGCILTPPTTQFQCDVGASPQGGFSVDCHGQLKYMGSGHFVACPTGDHGGYNIYTRPAPGQAKCVDITLYADGCHKDCQPTHPPPPQHCPTNLPGNTYEYPHLIVPVSSAHPHKAYGTSYRGQVSHSMSSYLNFDIPQGDAGKTCTFIFRLPRKDKLVTSSYSYGGSGGISFGMTGAPATEGTTYANGPHVTHNYGSYDVKPGHAYAIHSFPCPAGDRIGFKMTSHGTHLNYFQDYNPPAIGGYITVC